MSERDTQDLASATHGFDHGLLLLAHTGRATTSTVAPAGRARDVHDSNSYNICYIMLQMERRTSLIIYLLFRNAKNAACCGMTARKAHGRTALD